MGFFDRFLKPVECESCKILREIIEYERAEKRDAIETLTSLLKPQVIIQPESQPRVIQPKHQLWSRRRAELEKEDRRIAALKVNSPVVAKPDSEINKDPKVEQLEIELGIDKEEVS